MSGSLTFYQNAVVGVQAEADVADFTLSSADKLYYHFDCADGDSALWGSIFDAVQYQTIDNAHDEETAEADGQGGYLHRYEHHSGSPDFEQDDLIAQVRLLVNWFMMNNDSATASGDLDGATPITVTVIDNANDNSGDADDDQFLISTETWAGMLLDSTGRITANQLNLIIDHFGSRGRLAASTDGSKKLIQANLQKPPNDAGADATEIKIVMTYEVKVIVVDEHAITTPLASGAVPSADGLTGNEGALTSNIQAGAAGTAVAAGEENAMFSSKTFAFTNGTSAAGVAAGTAGSADLDASGAAKSGREDCLRFRKTYVVVSA